MTRAVRISIALVLALALGYAGLSALLLPPTLRAPDDATPTADVGAPTAAPDSQGYANSQPSNRPLVSPSAWTDADPHALRESSPRGNPAGERRWNAYLAATACMRKARALGLAERFAGANDHDLAEEMLKAEAAIESDCGRESDADHLIGLLRAAALAGHPTAQMLFFPEAATITFGSEAEAQKDPARLQRLKWESRTYLEHAVAAGDFDAAVLLAYHLRDGFYSGQSENAAALHYFRIAQRLRPGASLQSIISSLHDGD